MLSERPGDPPTIPRNPHRLRTIFAAFALDLFNKTMKLPALLLGRIDVPCNHPLV